MDSLTNCEFDLDDFDLPVSITQTGIKEQVRTHETIIQQAL
jgi:hypothetical protein